MSLKLFPVLGGASYSNDFAAARSNGRSHQGNDLFNREGTPLIAVDDGFIRFGLDPLGGNIANLRTTDNTRYYYAHLSGFEGSNRQVQAGEIIGYLGKTGNAWSTSPHLHFEIHPGGGSATNPFPILKNASIQQPGMVAKGVSKNILGPILIAGAIGLGTWLILNPQVFRAWTRKVLSFEIF